MHRATLFLNNKTQAVRLPKDIAFGDDVRQVDIIRIGNARILTPVGQRWDDYFLVGPAASDDFLSEREQGDGDERDAL